MKKKVAEMSELESFEFSASERAAIMKLAERFKAEMSEETRGELAGERRPRHVEIVNWHEKIDNLDLSKGRHWVSGERIVQLRSLLHDLLDKTLTVGGLMVNIGKRIVKWIFAMMEHFPQTVAAMVIVAALLVALACVPILGTLLMTPAQVVAIGFVGLAFFSECMQKLGVKVNNK